MSCCGTEEELHVGDWGTTFELTIKEYVSGVLTVVDISAATTKQILFKQPDGTVDVHTATFTTDGTDGKIEYTTADGDIDQEGDLKYRAKVITPSGNWQSSTCVKTVYAEWS